VAALKPGDAVPVQIERSGGGRGREYVVLKVPDKP
jgi:hypothetical protein